MSRVLREDRYRMKMTDASVRAALADAMDHADAGHDNMILLGDMPDYISDISGVSGDLYIFRNHAYENLVSKEQAIIDDRIATTDKKRKRQHFHELGEEIMTQAILSLNNPLITIADNGDDGNPGLSLILPVFDKNDYPVHAFVSFYADEPINGDHKKRPHIAVTFYGHPYESEAESGRKNITEFVQEAVDGNNVLDFDRKKLRVDLPVIAKNSTLGNIAETTLKRRISQFQKDVNRFKQNHKINYSRELDSVGDQITEGHDGGGNAGEAIRKSDIQAVQSIGRRSVNDFTNEDIARTEAFARKYWNELNVKSPFFRAWFGDWRANEQTPVAVANQQGDARGVQYNADTGWKIQISSKVFNESNHKGSKNQAALPYLHYIHDIVKKAVLLDSQTSDKGMNSLMMHSMYAVADIGNGANLIKLYVEEMYDPNKTGTTKRAYQLQNIEIGSLKVQGSPKTVSPISQTADIRTIADLHAAVKRRDRNFNPRPASKLVNADGTPKVYYHGTNAEWTQYDLSKNVNQMWGEGIYLTPDPKRAALFGDNVMPFYVKADVDNRTAKSTGKQRDYTIMKNGDILVYSPNQIKSATDNIGTFDGSNPDIRFSQEIPSLDGLREQNEALREKMDYWKGQTKRTTAENRTVRKGDVEKLARRLVKDNDKRRSVKIHSVSLLISALFNIPLPHSNR